MAEPDGGEPLGPAEEQLLRRISAGVSSIAPRADAGALVGGAITRRRHRRRVAISSGLAAVVVVVVAAATGVLVGGRGQGPEPSATPSTPAAYSNGSYAPARFFADLVGGSAVPSVERHHLVRGEHFFVRMNWTPDGAPKGEAIPVVIALERVHNDAAVACGRLVVGGADCQDLPDGAAVTRYEVPARDLSYDPVHRKAPFVTRSAQAMARGVTYVRADRLVVSVFVCSCFGDHSLSSVPVSLDQLQQVASSDTWVATG